MSPTDTDIIEPACALVCRAWLFQARALQPTRLLCLRHSPGRDEGGGCHFLLQEIVLTQGCELRLPCLLHCQAGSLPSEPLGKPLS